MNNNNNNNIGRLEEVLNQIKDEKVQKIVSGVFKVEISYRSTERVNFPWKRIRDVIERVAKATEVQDKQDTDEASEN